MFPALERFCLKGSIFQTWIKLLKSMYSKSKGIVFVEIIRNIATTIHFVKSYAKYYGGRPFYVVYTLTGKNPYLYAQNKTNNCLIKTEECIIYIIQTHLMFSCRELTYHYIITLSKIHNLKVIICALFFFHQMCY